MEFIEILKNQYLSIIFGGLSGIATSWLTQRILNKRGIFSYYVTHNKIGVSAQDSVFGNVSVTWNSSPIQHLFLSTIELKNESYNDYENFFIKAYTDDTHLLSESTQILNTPNIIELSEKYRKSINNEPNKKPTNQQITIYSSQREYVIPVLNRGEIIKISYLNAAKSEIFPSIWLSCTLKGVKIKHRAPQAQVLGVPQSYAALNGALIGILGVVPLVLYISNSWAIAIIAVTYGFTALIPGAYAIKAFRKAKEIIGG